MTDRQPAGIALTLGCLAKPDTIASGPVRVDRIGGWFN
jgi:hypothetical protein